MIDILLIDPNLSLIKRLEKVTHLYAGSLLFDCAGSHEEGLAKMISYPYQVAVVNGGSFSAGQVECLMEEFEIWELQAKLVIVGPGKSKNDALPYLQAGACAYVVKELSLEKLLSCLRSIAQNQMPLPPDLAWGVITRISALSGSNRPLNGSILGASPRQKSRLTSREQEVLALIAHGFSNREIADKLFIEVGTVKNHVHSLLSKLDLSSRQEAARVYLENEGRRFMEYLPVHGQISALPVGLGSYSRKPVVE